MGHSIGFIWTTRYSIKQGKTPNAFIAPPTENKTIACKKWNSLVPSDYNFFNLDGLTLSLDKSMEWDLQEIFRISNARKQAFLDIQLWYPLNNSFFKPVTLV